VRGGGRGEGGGGRPRHVVSKHLFFRRPPSSFLLPPPSSLSLAEFCSRAPRGNLTGLPPTQRLLSARRRPCQQVEGLVVATTRCDAGTRHHGVRDVGPHACDESDHSAGRASPVARGGGGAGWPGATPSARRRLSTGSPRLPPIPHPVAGISGSLPEPLPPFTGRDATRVKGRGENEEREETRATPVAPPDGLSRVKLAICRDRREL